MTVDVDWRDWQVLDVVGPRSGLVGHALALGSLGYLNNPAPLSPRNEFFAIFLAYALSVPGRIATYRSRVFSCRAERAHHGRRAVKKSRPSSAGSRLGERN